jgi:hypothetical protein
MPTNVDFCYRLHIYPFGATNFSAMASHQQFSLTSIILCTQHNFPWKRCAKKELCGGSSNNSYDFDIGATSKSAKVLQ